MKEKEIEIKELYELDLSNQIRKINDEIQKTAQMYLNDDARLKDEMTRLYDEHNEIQSKRAENLEDLPLWYTYSCPDVIYLYVFKDISLFTLEEFDYHRSFRQPLEAGMKILNFRFCQYRDELDSIGAKRMGDGWMIPEKYYKKYFKIYKQVLRKKQMPKKLWAEGRKKSTHSLCVDKEIWILAKEVAEKKGLKIKDVVRTALELLEKN